jgi:hypothetical protein
MIYGDFTLISLILVITLQNRKTLFCVFLCFRDLSGLKLAWDFLGVHILPREAPGAQEVNEGGHEAQKRLGGMGPSPGRATLSRLMLKPLLPSIFIS